MTYYEKHRPRIHYTPKKNWMNDPNGLVYFKGEYHLFYQYNPEANHHDNMHWGHAVSTDLYHWEERSVKLYPDELGTIFSGSVVVDDKNTSGLFNTDEGGLVAVFTHDGASQQQSIAYSEDRGRTWIKYKGNPVIPNTTIIDFRDPKVFWHKESSQWVMSLACGSCIRFYGSNNLIEWQFLSDFGSSYPSYEGVWECPDLIQLEVEDTGETEWVLIISINDGAPNGGSGIFYFTGQFDGKSFHPNESETDALKWADTGRDFYAAVSFDNTGTDTYWIGWMNNWQYAGHVPVSPWRSAMSLARQLSLVNTGVSYLLRQIPVINDDNEKNTEQNMTVTPEQPLSLHTGDAFLLDIRLKGNKDQSVWGVDFITNQDEVYRLSIISRENRYTFDRTTGSISFSEQFPRVIEGPLNGSGHALTTVVDVSSLELFFQSGLSVSTNLIFPEGQVRCINVWNDSGVLPVESLSIKPLRAVMAAGVSSDTHDTET